MNTDRDQITIIPTSVVTLPLSLTWSPKEDITTYELALSLNFFNRHVMPCEFDKDAPYARHFEIYDPNK